MIGRLVLVVLVLVAGSVVKVRSQSAHAANVETAPAASARG